MRDRRYVPPKVKVSDLEALIGGKYAGKRISRAKLPEAARRPGMSVEDAEKYITGEGGVIY